MGDYRHKREDLKYESPASAQAVQDGFTSLGRRPRGAAPGTIVSEDVAKRWEDSSSIYEDIFSPSHSSRRRSRLMRLTREVWDDEPYLDYEG